MEPSPRALLWGAAAQAAVFVAGANLPVWYSWRPLVGWRGEPALVDVWVMPEGTDASTIVGRMQELADDVVRRGWHLSPRLHILLWGDERGR